MNNLPTTLSKFFLLCWALIVSITGNTQELVDIKTDARYVNCVEAWDFNTNLKGVFSGKSLIPNNGKAAYLKVGNSNNYALRLKKNQFFSGMVEGLPAGNSKWAISFWMKSEDVLTKEFKILSIGEGSALHGQVNIAFTKDSKKGDIIKTSFNPSADDELKYTDSYV